MKQQELMVPEKQELAAQPPNLINLLEIALNNKAGIEVIERLAALQEKERAKVAELDFTNALAAVQAKLTRVAPDLFNSQTKSRYPSYAALDRAIRPHYAEAGFSFSFSTTDCPLPEHTRIVCYASLGPHTRTYQIDMPNDGKGAKGGDVMTKTHAMGASISYGMRYLLKAIFNVAIGEDDVDGNTATPYDDLAERLEWIENSSSLEELSKIYKDAYRQAGEQGDTNAQKQLIAAKDRKKKELS